MSTLRGLVASFAKRGATDDKEHEEGHRFLLIQGCLKRKPLAGSVLSSTSVLSFVLSLQGCLTWREEHLFFYVKDMLDQGE